MLISKGRIDLSRNKKALGGVSEYNKVELATQMALNGFDADVISIRCSLSIEQASTIVMANPTQSSPPPINWYLVENIDKQYSNSSWE